jgi:hypothetical protein
MAIQSLSKKAGLRQERSAMHYNLRRAIASLQDSRPTPRRADRYTLIANPAPLLCPLDA